MPENRQPLAHGLRQQWEDIPEIIRAKIEKWLGSPVVKTVSQLSGFSPGVASKLITQSGRIVFLKAIGSEINPRVPDIHRREAKVTKILPTGEFTPQLLWFLDDLDTKWVILVFENIDGHNPENPWKDEDLKRVMDALVSMSHSINLADLPTGIFPTARSRFTTEICGWNKLQDSDLSRSIQLDEWTKRNLTNLCQLEKQAPSAVDGTSLLHFDIRADNILLTSDKVWFVDWPHVCIGADWVDVVLFAPSVRMQGGQPPEDIIKLHPSCQTADPDAITATVASLAGFFSYSALLPPPPGLPTLREFQDAQGKVALEWLSERTGWV